MKFKEKTILSHSTIYVPEHFESKSIVGPSSDFIETIKGIKDLDFIENSTKEFINLCKFNILKSRY